MKISFYSPNLAGMFLYGVMLEILMQFKQLNKQGSGSLLSRNHVDFPKRFHKICRNIYIYIYKKTKKHLMFFEHLV